MEINIIFFNIKDMLKIFINSPNPLHPVYVYKGLHCPNGQTSIQEQYEVKVNIFKVTLHEMRL